jgi:dipeptidyl aminopeptidase/acylaminoacyl peptidase
MKSIINLVIGLMVSSLAWSQEDLSYQKPHNDILKLADVERAPTVRISTDGSTVVMLYRDAFKTISELSETELRLAGLRINPVTNIGSRTTYYNNIKTKRTKSLDAHQIKGLPSNPRLSNFNWSPDERLMAFTHTTDKQVELWLMDIGNAKAAKLCDLALNANFGNAFYWFPDGRGLLVKAIPEDRKALIETNSAIPSGPTVSVSNGEKAQNRTYQDLLKNPNDEFNFEQLARSTLFEVNLQGQVKPWAKTEMYMNIDFAPNGHLLLLEVMEKPFSYMVPYSRFPRTTYVYINTGERLEEIHKGGLIEELPKGFMSVQTGKRSIQWRSDLDATLIWAEALDEGDPEKTVEYRDAVYQLRAPFSATPTLLLKTQNRFSNIQWADATHAFAVDYWWNTRNVKTYLFNPSDLSVHPSIIHDRNYQDIYSDPGNFVRHRNELNQSVVAVKNEKVLLMGEGHTENGQFPFIDEYDLVTKKTTRLYQSNYNDKIEDILRAIDIDKGCYLVRIESPTEYPNFYLRELTNKQKPLTQITFNENPFTSLQQVEKSLIKYKRADGLELSGTLYLPPNYDKKEKLPLLIWAYPTEYKDKSSASQTSSNPNSFTYPYYGSFIYWVMRGYVVLDDAAFPIVGEGDKEPNDNFREQLIANAKAAIDAVDSLGYIDRNRVACGGHSYGAFMVANLLTHSDLFKAGIARSGAYNRTLTPFGFQSEERSYWDAPEVYNTMSPFMHADKMKSPLLLIHGAADNNSGTYPLQSERYFNALKGHGATARLVMLPNESHGYQAKESIMHVLWEQDEWLEKYVKNTE